MVEIGSFQTQWDRERWGSPRDRLAQFRRYLEDPEYRDTIEALQQQLDAL